MNDMNVKQFADNILNTLTEEQRNAVYALIGATIDNAKNKSNWALITNGTNKSWINLDRTSRITIGGSYGNEIYPPKFYIYADGDQLPVVFTSPDDAEKALKRIGFDI